MAFGGNPAAGAKGAARQACRSDRERVATGFGVADAELRVELVASHLAGLAFARYQLRIEPIASATVEDLVAWVGPTVQRYLTDPSGHLDG